jgi:large subunit ribosomal protein L18
MESAVIKRNHQRKKKLLRVRKQVRGTAVRPRLSVLRTNKHISAQLIDDENSVTIASAGSVQKAFRDRKLSKKSKETAKQVGMKIAEIAKSKKIEAVVFDRGRYKYHGVVAELANGAREVGLQF